jgi:hypothetical protein
MLFVGFFILFVRCLCGVIISMAGWIAHCFGLCQLDEEGVNVMLFPPMDHNRLKHFHSRYPDK